MHARARLAAAVLVAATALTAAPPARAGVPDNDCGSGRDTPPALLIANGGSCAGSMDGETYNFYGFPCTYNCVVDRYQFDATEDDFVSIGFSSGCSHWGVINGPWAVGSYSSGTFVAATTRRFDLGIGREAGFDGGGCSGSSDYTVGVSVVANTKPVLSGVSLPSTAKPAEARAYTLAAGDSDGNLRRIGVLDYPAYGETLWQTPDAAGRTTFTLAAGYTVTYRFVAEDVYGARSAVLSHTVTLVQDDCGTGGDVSTLVRAFPFACDGHLTVGLIDPRDSFEFDVPSGAHRVGAQIATTSGQLRTSMTLTAPGGAVFTGATGTVVATAAPGRWRLDVDRVRYEVEGVDVSWGGYHVSVADIGPPVPPDVSVEPLADPAPHQYEPVTLRFSATDPAAQRVWYSVSWGDGGTTRVPVSGFASSGATQQAVHEYAASAAGPRVVSVTATLEDGQSASAQTALVVRVPDDRCAGDSSPAADARPSSSQFDRTKFGHEFERHETWGCAGELGKVVEKVGVVATNDDADAYAFVVCATDTGCGDLLEAAGATGSPAGARLRVTLRPSGSLTARLVMGLGGSFQVLSSSPVGPGGTATISVPTGAASAWWYVYVQRQSGTGAYALDVSTLPPA